MFDFNNPTGIDVKDQTGASAIEVLNGSPSGVYSSPPNAFSTSVIVKDTQPGENTLMKIPPFTVTNTELVRVVITGPTGDVYTKTVNISTKSQCHILSKI